MTAIPIKWTSVLTLVTASVFGLAAFCWPLVIAVDSPLAGNRSAPWIFAAVVPVVLAVVLAQLSDDGMDAKAVAMLGVLSALGAALRPLGGGTGGIETMFVLLVFAGRVFGPGFGFALGNTAMMASALITGGVGPWLPYQMLAAAWFGLGAGLLPRLPAAGRRWTEPVLLATYGAVASLLFGILMNLSFWPFAIGGGTELSYQPGAGVWENVSRLLAFSFATSLGWDVGRAITTSVLVLVTGPIALRVLRRAARRATFVASSR